MTRGKGFILYDDPQLGVCVAVTTEFNGDMMADGHGQEFLDGISAIDSNESILSSFYNFTKEFNENHHKYPEKGMSWFHFEEDQEFHFTTSSIANEEYNALVYVFTDQNCRCDNILENVVDNQYANYYYIRNMQIITI